VLVRFHLSYQISQLTKVDFNDKTNLDLYFKIRLFKSDLSNTYLVFKDHAKLAQLRIPTIAESLDLEYEYSVRRKVVRLSRPESADAQTYLSGRQITSLTRI
jgi:hypothetical protein